MSRFSSERLAALDPYVPGEQPRDMKYVKLNTNESPFPPAPAVLQAVAAEAGKLNLYCDPDCTRLRAAAAALYGLAPENILPVNGSDEALYFAFTAFCGSARPMAFADITYGFYPVFAAVTGTPAHILPLREDFSLDPADYCGLHENIVLANPNARIFVGGDLPAAHEFESARPRRLRTLRVCRHVVVIDEAYVDFGGESCVPLIGKYDNLLVVQTFSKSRSLAGARLGFALGNAALIGDLNTVKFSTNPYNVNRMTQAAGEAAIASQDYTLENCRRIMENRAYTARALEDMGFRVLPSKANFLFAAHPAAAGQALYRALKDRGVLVRWFDKPRIREWLRITIGSREQMDALLAAMKTILNDERGA